MKQQEMRDILGELTKELIRCEDERRREVLKNEISYWKLELVRFRLKYMNIRYEIREGRLILGDIKSYIIVDDKYHLLDDEGRYDFRFYGEADIINFLELNYYGYGKKEIK